MKRILSIDNCIFIVFLFALTALTVPNLPSLDLSESQKNWLANHPVIKIAPDPDFPPTEFFDKEGDYRGIAADFIKEIESMLGIQFQIVHLKNWSECIEKAKSREIDMFGAATPTEQRSEYMLFTRPFVEFPAIIVVNDTNRNELNLDSLAGKKTAVVTNYAIHDYLSANYPNLDLYPVPDVLSGLMEVSLGEADAFVGNMATTTYTIGTSGVSNLRLAGRTDYTFALSMAVRKDWPELQQILDKAIGAVPEKRKKEIVDNWVHFGGENFWENRTFWIVLISVSAGIILFVSLILLWNHSLHRLVKERTTALSGELEKRKIALARLEESENRFRTLVHNIPGAVYRCGTDVTWPILLISPDIENISGYPSSDFIGNHERTYRSIIFYEDRKMVEEQVEHSLSMKTPFSLEYRIVRKDGSLRWVAERGQGVYSDKGEVQYIDGVILDITEKKKMEEQLRLSQKRETIGVLASGFAHDFNNVLGGITATVSTMKHKLARKGEIEREKLAEYLDVLEDCGERSSLIVQQLMSLSRKQENLYRQVDLNNLIGNVMKICEITFDRSLTLETCCYKSPAMARVDPAQIEQALLNLCINAAHSMTLMRENREEWGGTITINLELISAGSPLPDSLRDNVRGNYWRLSVEDRGVGIPDSVTDKIFSPFYSTKDKEKGMGLGLSMVNQILREHRGTVDFRSEQGSGSTFYLYIPVWEETEEKTEDSSSDKGFRGTEKILVMDSEEITRWSAKEILTECGYEVVLAESCSQCLELFEREHETISLILTSLSICEMTCFGACEKIQKIKPTIKILLTTGSGGDDRIEEVRKRGFCGIISKPFTLEKIASSVRAALDGNPL